MLSELLEGPKSIGLKQSQRAVMEETAHCAYVAQDAESHVTEPFMALCREHDVTVYTVSTMKQLGEACGIDVGAAVVVLLKQQ
ncbi:ribosomal L7Ae/L30e/S12e/Gadd45 family protein [Acidaminobacterium chupaoyuni]